MRTPTTLAVDCGGGGIKASVLDATGTLHAQPVRAATPYPLPPERLLAVIASLARQLPPAGRVTVGMPGMLRHGVVVATPHYITRAGDAVLGPLRHWLESVPRWAWVTVETASAVGLLVWAIVRVRTGLGPDKQGGARSAPLWMLVAIAVGLAVAAFADPGYSGAVLAGSGHPASWRVVGLTLWYLIAMSPLVLVCIADGLGATARVSAWLHRWLSRSRRPVWIITTALIVVVAVLLAIDALLLAATGKFLP